MTWSILICFSFILAHELDAIDKKEWRIFPGTNLLPDQLGFNVFTLLHIPIFGLLIWAMFMAPEATQDTARTWFAAFSILHILAHYFYRNHKEYRFNNLFSNSLIWGAGLFGAIYLVMGFA